MLTLPSKLASERIQFTIDYSDMLPWGAVISSARLIVTVSSGVDALPQQVFWKIVSIIGNKVTYRVRLGTPGVIYLLTFGAYAGAVWYEKARKLAILLDYANIAALYPFTRIFTSLPYGAEIVGINYSEAVAFLGGELKSIGLGYLPNDSDTEITALVGGLLRETPTGNVVESSNSIPTLVGGLLQAVATGNVVESSNSIPALIGGALIPVPTGNIVEHSNEIPALVGGQLS